MAAGNVSLVDRIATVECDANKFKLESNQPSFFLTNKGPNNVYLGMTFGAGDLQRDGLGVDGEVELEPGDGIPIPQGTTKVEFQCKAAEMAVMWYNPIQS